MRFLRECAPFVLQNKQNLSGENPRELHQRPHHSAKGLCRISKLRIVGMWQNFLLPKLQQRPVNMEELWFQQDCVTCSVQSFVSEMFLGLTLSRLVRMQLFFCWVILILSVNKAYTIQKLKSVIRQEITKVPEVPEEMILRICTTLKRSCRWLTTKNLVVIKKKDLENNHFMLE